MSIVTLLLAAAILTMVTCGPDRGHKSTPETASGQGNQTDSRDKDALAKDVLKVRETAVPHDWTRVSARGFSFSVPPDMVEREVQGLDSYVRSFRFSSFVLNLDYGMYTAAAETPDELIDGKRTKITEEERVSDVDGIRYEKYADVQFEDIGRAGLNLSMYIYGKTGADQATAKIIFRSIRFESYEN